LLSSTASYILKLFTGASVTGVLLGDGVILGATTGAREGGEEVVGIKVGGIVLVGSFVGSTDTEGGNVVVGSFVGAPDTEGEKVGSRPSVATGALVGSS